MARRVLPQLTPQHWQEGQHRFLQEVDDAINRPLLNRVSIVAPNTALTTNGSAALSAGIGTPQIQPKRYAEFTVKARVTFNINSTGPAFVYVFRTLGNTPANGSGMNVGDVVVSGDAFGGGTTVSGINEIATLSFLDSGLDVTKKYRYYFAGFGPNGNVLNFINSSQILVMERS